MHRREDLFCNKYVVLHTSPQKLYCHSIDDFSNAKHNAISMLLRICLLEAMSERLPKGLIPKCTCLAEELKYVVAGARAAVTLRKTRAMP